MNTFDGFTLTGANITRYVPIIGDATKIIGAYRKHVKSAGAVGIGKIPLFLLDGELADKTLNRAIERLEITNYIALYRPFDIKIKKRYKELDKKMRSWGFIKKDGTVADWVMEDARKFKEKVDGWEGIKPIQDYIDFENTKDEYETMVKVPIVDAVNHEIITEDVNQYLFERAKSMFPIGIESILIDNKRQSASPKTRFFMDGFLGLPVPKGVHKDNKTNRKMALFNIKRTGVDDPITELQRFFRQQIEQQGIVTLPEIIHHCARIGLYRDNNITLYVLGAAFKEFDKEDAVFYDGVTYWKFAETRDISSWILRAYQVIQPRLVRGELVILNRAIFRAAIFYDNTTLKDRLRGIFGIETPDRPEYNTLGGVIVKIGQWVVENLQYPIAFLDEMLYHLYCERSLFGEKMQLYNDYFTPERCKQIKGQLPHADDIAQDAIRAALGFVPEYNLPKGHYAPILWSAEDYLEIMGKYKASK